MKKDIKVVAAIIENENKEILFRLSHRDSERPFRCRRRNDCRPVPQNAGTEPEAGAGHRNLRNFAVDRCQRRYLLCTRLFHSERRRAVFAVRLSGRNFGNAFALKAQELVFADPVFGFHALGRLQNGGGINADTYTFRFVFFRSYWLNGLWQRNCAHHFNDGFPFH